MHLESVPCQQYKVIILQSPNLKSLTSLVVRDGSNELDDVLVVFQLSGKEVDLGHHLQGIVLREPRCQTRVLHVENHTGEL